MPDPGETFAGYRFVHLLQHVLEERYLSERFGGLCIQRLEIGQRRKEGSRSHADLDTKVHLHDIQVVSQSLLQDLIHLSSCEGLTGVTRLAFASHNRSTCHIVECVRVCQTEALLEEDVRYCFQRRQFALGTSNRVQVATIEGVFDSLPALELLVIQIPDGLVQIIEYRCLQNGCLQLAPDCVVLLDAVNIGRELAPRYLREV